jgi:hypothetical protein
MHCLMELLVNYVLIVFQVNLTVIVTVLFSTQGTALMRMHPH